MTDSAPHFRPAGLADLPAIIELLADDSLGSSREAPGEPLDLRYTQAFAAIERDPNQLLIVADRGGEAIGVLQLTFIPGLTRRGMWRGQIEGVRIAARERGTGLGRAMLEWAIGRSRERGCGVVQLTATIAAPPHTRSTRRWASAVPIAAINCHSTSRVMRRQLKRMPPYQRNRAAFSDLVCRC
jgi:GNAT superfamily N-acetyltransferase